MIYVGLFGAFSQSSQGSPAVSEPAQAPCSPMPGVSDSGPFSWPVAVFFDSFSEKLSLRGEEALARFKRLAIRCNVHRIVLDAHVDAAEAEKSHGLDSRRARTVREFLSDSALPAEVFSVALWGNTHPTIQTSKRVAEPQNRFVMIRVRD